MSKKEFKKMGLEDLSNAVTPVENLSTVTAPEEVKIEEKAIEEVAAIEETKFVAKQPITQNVPLRVFATVAGPKWDQLAGFVSHARRSNLGPMPLNQWHDELKKFMEKPIG